MYSIRRRTSGGMLATAISLRSDEIGAVAWRFQVS
jgi:hypothetical protein